MPQRLEQLNRWLSEDLELSDYEIAPASADASFRRYFRIRSDGGCHIAMDAPPQQEDSRPFVAVGRALFQAGLNVPQILQQDLEQGFLLLSDLGSQPYLDALNEQSVERLYGDALGALAVMQTCVPADDLPAYDEALLQQEMALFRDWFLTTHLGLELSETEQQLLSDTFALLTASALEQPQVFVHRDYHSRNLMVAEHNPGILDFQDAVLGPVTYDLVSLLRDCYIAWPRQQVEEWVQGYHDIALDHGIIRKPMSGQFLRWFDLMGVQRHLKVLGIFCRLNYRDEKSQYLNDLPLTLKYILDTCELYDELKPLQLLLKETITA